MGWLNRWLVIRTIHIGMIIGMIIGMMIVIIVVITIEERYKDRQGLFLSSLLLFQVTKLKPR